MKKTFKVIIDTDPGVDDTNALVYVMNDPQFDIKLFTISNGNINLDKATRNMCHLLDLFHKDTPVVKGLKKRFGGNTEDATFLHTKEGLGGYVPPKTTVTQPQKKDVADAMYEVLKANPKEITVIVLGPHTNFAYLLQKHPDAKDLVKDVLMMGGAPMGIAANPNHNSFNIRTDAPAFKQTIDSALPITMCPSSIGRDEGYFSKEHVEEIKNTNDLGKFLDKTFETYWEPEYNKTRIATNDLSAIYYLPHPKLYKTKSADIEVDIKTGKTTAHFKRKGQFKIVVGLKRKKFIKLMLEKLKNMSDIKIPELYVATASKQKTQKKTTGTPVTKTTKSKTAAKAPTQKASTKTKTQTQKSNEKTTKTSTTKTAAKKQTETAEKKPQAQKSNK